VLQQVILITHVATGNLNRVSVTSYNKKMYNINGVRIDCRDPLEISQ